MKSDIENLSNTRVKFTVELPFDELSRRLTHAYKRIGKQVQIPGFRKGKVPRADHRPARRSRHRSCRRSSTTVSPAYDQIVKRPRSFRWVSRMSR